MGDRLSWRDIVESICQTVSPDHIQDICAKCRWLDFDYCSRGLSSRCGTGTGSSAGCTAD